MTTRRIAGLPDVGQARPLRLWEKIGGAFLWATAVVALVYIDHAVYLLGDNLGIGVQLCAILVVAEIVCLLVGLGFRSYPTFQLARKR